MRFIKSFQSHWALLRGSEILNLSQSENGMGGAATAFSIPIPMPALRQN